MLFRLQSSDKGTMTHCGVLEFSAPEGSCYIPYWMMQNLLIEEGSVISITNVSLPKATFVKLQPQHVDFLEITNPRAVLEHALRNFSCVTKGDVIQLPFCNKNYHFELKEVQPQDAACIIETDCNVDFDAPVGYKEPSRNVGDSQHSASVNGGNDSLSETLAKIPKQSAHANRNSTCPSPSLSSMSGTSAAAKGSTHGDSSSLGGGDGGGTAASSNRLRIVDGKVVRPQNEHENGNLKNDEDIAMMASKTGGTGVQRNAAIAVKAPQVDYWALNGGDGARLDGKKPVALKDSEGNELDIRKLRAEAAKRRMEAMVKEGSVSSMPSCGKMVNGKTVSQEDTDNSLDATKAGGGAAPGPKRKSRIGSKYSKLKKSGGFAFQGSANTFK